jgi:segregation and condensation protein B
MTDMTDRDEHDPTVPATTGPAPTADELLGLPAWQVDVSEPAATPAAPPERPAPAPAPRPAAAEEPPPPAQRIVEALLFAGGAPLTAERAGEIVRGLMPDDFHQALDALNRDYRAQGRPYLVQKQDHGYVLALRPRFTGVRDRLHGGVREARLSQAAVDVLSLVAYRQPATRAEVDSLRGADSAALLRQLVRHGLVALQRGEGEHREVTYVTTTRFLELFDLRSLDDLPQTQDLERL